MYTADNPGDYDNGALADLPVVTNFGPGNAQKAFASLKEYRPNGPLMSGEYWAGWFDAWGTRHANTNGQQQADEIAWMLAQGYSFNLYMFHGGTSFGYMSGANFDRNGYKPDVSSYDYDSALDEAGRPAPKFALFRNAIQQHEPTLALPPMPVSLPAIDIPAITFTSQAPLWNALPAAVHSERVKTMEEIGQSYGYINYRKTMATAMAGELVLTELHDYALVFVNGTKVATLDRRLKQSSTPVSIPAGGTLDIFVENTARSNYGKGLRNERKGITDTVEIGGVEITGWDIAGVSDSRSARWSPSARETNRSNPSFYRGTFTLSQVGDTFLDFSAWGKGTAWVNGHQLGRFWNIGPQQTLFVPAPWLKAGDNEVIVFDLEPSSSAPTLAGRRDPILNVTKR